MGRHKVGIQVQRLIQELPSVGMLVRPERDLGQAQPCFHGARVALEEFPVDRVRSVQIHPAEGVPALEQSDLGALGRQLGGT